LVAYKDSEGIWTVGRGRNLEGKGMSDEELARAGLTTNHILYENLSTIKITREVADFLFQNDLKEVETALKKYRWFNPLDQVRKDVIIDMAFNMGIPRLLGFNKMIIALCINDYYTASEEMLRSKWYKQVGNRAIELSMMMHSGVYLSKEQLYLISARKY
jgi:lysozyme